MGRPLPGSGSSRWESLEEETRARVCARARDWGRGAGVGGRQGRGVLAWPGKALSRSARVWIAAALGSAVEMPITCPAPPPPAQALAVSAGAARASVPRAPERERLRRRRGSGARWHYLTVARKGERESERE